MPLILPGADTRPIIGRCRFCKTTWREGATDRQMARHMAQCAREYLDANREWRARNAWMAPQDPELEAHMRREYLAGRLKPSTDPI